MLGVSFRKMSLEGKIDNGNGNLNGSLDITGSSFFLDQPEWRLVYWDPGRLSRSRKETVGSARLVYLECLQMIS